MPPNRPAPDALCNGGVGPTTTVVEASSGSTAVSEAYFARLIKVPFIAVMARTACLRDVRGSRGRVDRHAHV